MAKTPSRQRENGIPGKRDPGGCEPTPMPKQDTKDNPSPIPLRPKKGK